MRHLLDRYAAQLAVDAQELRKLASEHARDYERLTRRARNEVLRESLDAALATLRSKLTSPELRVSMVAATTIVRYDLARMRYGQKDAGAKLDRESRRSSRRESMADKAHEVRNENVRESTKVTNPQDVNAAKKSAQSTPKAPANAAPSPPAPTPQTATPQPAPPVTPVAQPGKPSVADAIRRERLLEKFARGQTPPAPITKGVPQTLGVDRLISGWLTEG